MRRDEYLKSELLAIRDCPLRESCPIGTMCIADVQEGNQALIPQLISIAKDDLVWTDLRNEQRVLIIKSGLFVAVAMDDADNEDVFAIYGPGYAVGLAELYISRSVCDTYYLKALTDAVVCSVPARALRQRLEALAPSLSNSILCSSLTNWSAACFEMSKLYALQAVWDRLVVLFNLLRQQLGAIPGANTEFGLSQDDLAFLIHADRTSVNRVLHRMEEQGMVKLGYKSIALCEGFETWLHEELSTRMAHHHPAGAKRKNS